ncbi:glycosyltransferase family 2 protein [Hanstruepera ponticola]|uniref:glycosyltransferase family 2 protein n=1 Tax=Hanstruepera ponticola TaxID=2042995 RepID=UPI0013C42A10|nr:glycosyltransferase [Hanstruepera ponticola]
MVVRLNSTEKLMMVTSSEAFLSKYQKKKVEVYKNQVAKKPLVSICVQTYNHEPYIGECLDSLINQVVDFDYEILLGEDASNDNTRKICIEYADKYPEKIRLFFHHRENNIKVNGAPTGKFNYFYNLISSNGKYIAFCEGDDYWIDSNKLQKQVDFMELKGDCNITWTDYKIFNGNSFGDTDFKFDQKEIKLDYHNIFRPYCTYTLTALFRKSALDFETLFSLKRFKDNSLYILLLKDSYGVFLNFISAVYRVHEGGVYSLKSNLFKNYSSYKNLKEVTDLVPESKTQNIKKVLRSLGNAAAFEILKLKYAGEDLSKEHLDFMSDYFKNADMKNKFKYYRRLIKLRFLK